MDIKLPCGAVICTNNEDIVNQLLKYGGVEYKTSAKADKADKTDKTDKADKADKAVNKSDE